MKPCKRIEIVIEEPMAPKLIELLQGEGGQAYTCIHDIGGDGDRGTRRADELTGDSSNSLFIIACEDAEKVERIVALVRPLIQRSGGVCLVSDAMWLRH